MLINEFLFEDVSSIEAQKHIRDVFTTMMPLVYQRLKQMADKFADDHGELGKPFRFVAGGVKARWMAEVYFPHLRNSLYKYSQSLNRNVARDLNNYLSETIGRNSFTDLEEMALPILAQIARDTKNREIAQAVATATAAYDAYTLHIEKINARLEAEDDEYANSAAPSQPAAPKQANIVGQQNASVDTIVNDVLSRISPKIAGEIRNSIAKSGNKLAALQQELNRRGIKP